MSHPSRGSTSGPGALKAAVRLFSFAGFLTAPFVGLAEEARPELVTIVSERFPLPDELRPNVDFWVKVYTGYDSNHVLLHDERYLHVVYAVLDFTAFNESEKSEVRQSQNRRKEIRAAVTKYRTILNNLAAGKTSQSYPEDQARVGRLFEAVPGKGGSKYSAAIRRLRTQTCIRDRFIEGIERSGIYLSKIEEIFLERGLPWELSRLPFVESLFQIRARSSAAAVGIWQFVRPTAQSYLKMELEFDERYDPLRASEGAAEYLAANYEALGTWPLAVTAYNHGANGMKRAVRLLGTRDFAEIAERYRSRSFGFASRNFYSEFIAAADVYANREHYFPGVEPLPEMEFDLFVTPSYVPVRELTKQTSASLEDVRELNPALTREIWSDDLYLPTRYRLRVPRGTGGEFRTAYVNLADHLKSSHQVGLYYRVKRGDTLSKIAGKFGTSASALQRVNSLRSPHRIREGQSLLIPPAGGAGRSRARTTTTATAITGPRPSTHEVRKGETLTLIAQRYGLSLGSLRAANQLADADRIYVGQRLAIPASDQRIHIVRRGDTLAKIARLYSTSVRALKEANGLRGDLIRPSQVLVVP